MKYHVYTIIIVSVNIPYLNPVWGFTVKRDIIECVYLDLYGHLTVYSQQVGEWLTPREWYGLNDRPPPLQVRWLCYTVGGIFRLSPQMEGSLLINIKYIWVVTFILW